MVYRVIVAQHVVFGFVGRCKSDFMRMRFETRAEAQEILDKLGEDEVSRLEIQICSFYEEVPVTDPRVFAGYMEQLAASNQTPLPPSPGAKQPLKKAAKRASMKPSKTDTG